MLGKVGDRRPSKATQETVIGDGLAIGCISLGASEIPGNKLNARLAFQAAWHGWSPARDFPDVHASTDTDDFYRILNQCAGRRTGVMAWEIRGVLVPRRRHLLDWQLEDVAAHVGSDFGLTLREFEQLAGKFLTGLKINVY